MTHALTERAMVMNLSIGLWQGYRLDKDATRRVTDEAGAAADAARVNKHLIPKEDLAAIVTASGAIRTHFYTNTLPWRDNGDRLMPRKLFEKFIPEHEQLVTAFKDEVEIFVRDRYPAAIARAEFRMGSMFNRDDYPTPFDVRRKFYANLDIDPVSTSGDFRVQMDQEHVDSVKAQIEARAADRLQAATYDVWKRMAETIGRFHERMAVPDQVFRESTVTSIGELLDLVPGLNVLDDPAIETVRQAIAKSLGGIDARDIRKDPALRSELAGEAKQIMDTMRGFMRAFGAGNS